MLIRLSYWVILSLSHHTIIISEAMRQQIKNWPFISKKISIVHNGIKQASLYSQANARHALYGIFPQLKKIAESVGDKNLFWVGSIAELHHIKGFEYAIRAIRHCITEIKNSYPQKTVIFTVFGEGEERQYLENLIRQMQLEDHVFLLGHTADAAQYVPALDVFMLSSLSEGLGYVLLEAGLAHAPVVATAVGGIPEIIRDMNSGILVQSRNPQELAHALVFMLDHPAERKQYGNALKERVTSQFTLEKMLEGVIKAYKKE
jgi:glycosyltransferase involved in cell wall biosynthesis